MDQRTVFRKALENPLDVSVAEFEQLVRRYPYAQPIVFAFERKKFLEGLPVDKQRTLIYASNPYWLKDYLQKPVPEVPELEVDTDDYIAYEELEDEEVVTTDSDEELYVEDVAIAEDEEQEEISMEGGAISESTVETVVSEETEEKVGIEEEPAIEPLAFDPPSTYNIEKEYAEEAYETEVEKPTEALEVQNERTAEENISLYNDELMPYSFRWWLYKTRLEHADTYQPFSTPSFPKAQKGQFDPRKLDEAILDQQIRENIFHLQNPEDKLSAENQKKTVEFKSSEKMDEVIDKFIREEPQIQPPKAESINNENKARRSSEDQLNVVTETLANIYESQGMYEKAVMVFRKLISENPEKKSYFATRIKEIEQKL